MRDLAVVGRRRGSRRSYAVVVASVVAALVLFANRHTLSYKFMVDWLPTAWGEVVMREAVANDGSGRKRWYVVHTYSLRGKGQEEPRRQDSSLGGLEAASAISWSPTEQVVEMKRRRDEEPARRKSMPGHILVQMAMNAAAGTW